jgi:hypothetical protein
LPRLKSRVRIPFLAQDCSSGGIGRHAGLKILWALARAGSSPASSTKNQIECVGILDVLKVEMVLDENQFKLFYFQAEEISKMLFAMIKT